MNIARNIRSKSNAYEYKGIKTAIQINRADIISLESIKNLQDRKAAEKMTTEYLNEKLAYFYNNGGPIMEL